MQELYWTWGLSKDNVSWYLRVSVVDTDMYAMAYYSLDDTNPMRYYESQYPELVRMLIDIEDKEAFIECRDQKNMLINIQQTLDEATIANFM